MLIYMNNISTSNVEELNLTKIRSERNKQINKL